MAMENFWLQSLVITADDAFVVEVREDFFVATMKGVELRSAMFHHVQHGVVASVYFVVVSLDV